MKTEEIIDILESLVGCCIMKPKDSEKFLKEAANSIMDLPISKEECANYARSKAEAKQHKGYHMSDGDTSPTPKAVSSTAFNDVTDGEIEEAAQEYLITEYPETGRKSDDYWWNKVNDETKNDFEAGAKWMREQHGEGWISVEDRLPELHESVIISKPSDFPDKVYVGWLSEKGRWFEEDGPDGIADVEVCHWMPLPNPPKCLTDKQ